MIGFFDFNMVLMFSKIPPYLWRLSIQYPIPIKMFFFFCFLIRKEQSFFLVYVKVVPLVRVLDLSHFRDLYRWHYALKEASRGYLLHEITLFQLHL